MDLKMIIRPEIGKITFVYFIGIVIFNLKIRIGFTKDPCFMYQKNKTRIAFYRAVWLGFFVMGFCIGEKPEGVR